jgi:2-octaprenylphenol hydroxylase
MVNYDVLIVGGGIVGLTQALALQGSGLSIGLIEAQASQGMPKGDAGLRVTALTLASQTILERLGAWQHLDKKRLTPYTDMQVWDQDSFAKIDFTAAQVKQTELGYIVENQAIRHSLWIEAQSSAAIQILAPSSIERLAFGQQECFVTLDDGSHVSARLVIGADGAHSKVKQQANLAQVFWDYDQRGIVATIKTEHAHHNIARQVFTPTGPLAFLPLWEPNQCSIVWSQDEEHAQRLLALPSADFDKALTAAFGAQLGLCETISQRQSYPLTMRYLRQWVDDGVAVIGDAAHTIHPLAGQGANLGMLDALALAEQICSLVQQDKDFSQAKNLRPFERWRKTETVKMIAVMETFKRLFSGRQPVKKLLRDLGLSAVNHIPLAKKTIIKQAMGLTGELPRMAQTNKNMEE